MSKHPKCFGRGNPHDAQDCVECPRATWHRCKIRLVSGQDLPTLSLRACREAFGVGDYQLGKMLIECIAKKINRVREQEGPDAARKLTKVLWDIFE